MKIKTLVLTAVLATAILCLALPAGPAKAACSAGNDMICQINGLNDQIKQLSAELPTVCPSGGTVTEECLLLQIKILQVQLQVIQLQDQLNKWCYTFTQYLITGSTDATTNGEVSKLQVALAAKQGFILSGDDNGVFGEGTAAGVVAFQTKYEITPTGTVGPKTRGMLNELYQCQPKFTITSLGTSNALPGEKVAVYVSNLPTGASYTYGIIFVGGSTGGDAAATLSADGTYLGFTVPNMPAGNYQINAVVYGPGINSNSVPFTIGSATQCTTDADCPPVSCLVAPCPASKCVDGQCKLVFTCAESGQKVYYSSTFGPTTCCSKNAGIKPSATLSGTTCVAPTDGSQGTCVENWWQTCGDGKCDATTEDKCKCPKDCSTTPSITVTYPNGLEGFYTGDIVQIKWNSTNIPASENVKIELAYSHTDSTYTAGYRFEDFIIEKTPNTGSYSWKIPEFYGTGLVPNSFAVKVSYGTGTADYSNEYFSIKMGVSSPSLTVNPGPIAGEKYVPGDKIAISWTPYDSSAAYSLTLLKKSDSTFIRWATLYPDYNKPGTYYWSVLPEMSGADYYLRVETSTTASRTNVGYSNVFSISNSAPFSADIKANGSSSPTAVPYKSVFEVSWTSTGATSCVGYGHYVPLADGTGYWTDLHNLPTSGSRKLVADHKNFGYTTPLQVGIQCFASNGSSVSQNVWVPVSAIGTYVTVISPNGGETWAQGMTYDIKWTSSGINNVTAYLLYENGTSCFLGNALASQGKFTYMVGTQCPDGSGREILPGNYRVMLSGRNSSSYNESKNIGWIEKILGFFVPTAQAQSSGPSDGSDNYFKIVSATEGGYDACRLDKLDGTNITRDAITEQASCLSKICDVYGPANLANGLPSKCMFKGTEIKRYEGTTAGDLAFPYGQKGWVPVSGDWNGDKKVTIGLYDPVNSVFYLKNTNGTGYADATFAFGSPSAGWQPIAGDWNGDGTDSVGLYDPKNSVFYLKNTNSAASGHADITFGFGSANWKPVAGDWNGDGIDTIGLYDPVNHTFYLRNYNASSSTAEYIFGYGEGIWTPIAGDWDGDGKTTIGLYDPAASLFYLRNSNTMGYADWYIGYGSPNAGWLPVVGDWNNDKTATPGVYDSVSSTFYLKGTNTNSSSANTSASNTSFVASLADAIKKVADSLKFLMGK